MPFNDTIPDGLQNQDTQKLISLIDELERSQRIITAERDRLLAIGDNIPNGALIQITIDPETLDMSITYLSKTWDRLTGLIREDSMNDISNLLEVIHPEDLPHLMEILRSFISNPEPIHTEFRFYQKPDNIRWLQLSATRHAGKDMVIADGYISDITEQKYTEHRLMLEKDWLQAIGDNLPGGALIQTEVDMKTQGIRFTYLSRTWEKITDLSTERSLADITHVFAIIHPDDLRLLKAKIDKSAQYMSTLNMELRFYRNKTEMRWLHLSSHPHPEGSKIISDGFISDITDQKLFQQKQELFRDELKQAVETRTQQLRESNEKLAELNEELQSVNEELAVMNEELQSVNEELYGQNIKLEEEIKLRKELLQQLENNREIVKNFIEQSLEGIVIINNEGKVIEWNPQQEKITGISHHVAMGEYEWKLLAKHTYTDNPRKLAMELRKSRLAFLRNCKTQNAITEERRFRLPDGNSKYLFSSIFPIVLSHTCFIGIITHDITERKKIHAELAAYRTQLEQMVANKTLELRRSEAMYRQLILASPYAIIMCDPEMKMLYISPRAKELFRIDHTDDSIHLKLINYVHPYDHKQVTDVYDRIIREDIVVFPNILLVREDHSEFFGEISMAPVKNDEGEITSVILIVLDITERKNNEIELVRAKEKAEESDMLKSAFLANMSHEIRTPLNGINGFLHFLSDDGLPSSRRQEYINIIRNSSNQLVRIIDDIIDVSKIEARQMDIYPVSFRLNDLMAETHAFFEKYMETNHKDKITLLTDTSGCIDNDTLYADPVRLRQILTNLINNAIKFTEKGYVLFGYRINEAGMLEFKVEDTGIGLDEKQMNKIFDRFWQAEKGGTRNYGGAGLGLTISKNLVRLMGGEMRVRSTIGKGSTFYFTLSYLPVAEEDKVLFTEDKATETTRQNPLSILFVEPGIMKYKYYEKLLSRSPITLLHAADTRQWLEHLSRSVHIDMAFVNSEIFRNANDEDISGIRSVRADLPIGLIISTTEKKNEPWEQQCPFCEIIQEPLNYRELYKVIKKISN